jgi:hypothetical protein
LDADIALARGSRRSGVLGGACFDTLGKHLRPYGSGAAERSLRRWDVRIPAHLPMPAQPRRERPATPATELVRHALKTPGPLLLPQAIAAAR